MPAPFGNQNAKGSRGGSGRPSAYQERQDAEFLWGVWFGEVTQEEVVEAIDSGHFGARHRMAEKALEGDTKMLMKLMDKLFPNTIKQENTNKTDLDALYQAILATREQSLS